MRVIATEDMPALLDYLGRTAGKIHGPIRRLGSDFLFGLRLAEEIDLSGGLPVNSPKDVLLTQLERVVAGYRQSGDIQISEQIVLFGIRPCDLRALLRIEEKLAPYLGPGIIVKKLCALVAANVCLCPAINCFCSAVDGSPILAEGSDFLLHDAGGKFYVDIQSERGAELAVSLPELLREPRGEEEMDFSRLRSGAQETHRLPDVKNASLALKEEKGSLGYLDEYNGDCVYCGACSFSCPAHLSRVMGWVKDWEGNSQQVIETTPERLRRDRRLPFRRKLTGALWKDEIIDCVGCGRCSTLCPSGLGMIETVDAVNGLPLRHQPKARQSNREAVDWIGPYRHKIVTPLQAFAKIKRGDSVFLSSACAEPQYLAAGFIANSQRFMDVEVIHLLSMGNVCFDDQRLTDHLRLNAFFVGDSSREAVASGRADYTPVFLSEIPNMMRAGRIPVDVAMIQVAPPDKHGYCSFGVSVETVKAATECARYVVAQVNPRMPRTHGDSVVHIDRLHALVPYEEPLIEWRPPPLDENSRRIAQFIAGLIEDGATLQIGIGKIGQALLPFLIEKEDLGIHTQMITDWVMELMKKGAVNNSRKRQHAGKTVATMAVGTQNLYDWLHNNPAVELYGMGHVGNPDVVARNWRMTAINSAFEVDLTGQVCADSIHHQFYSGVASMADFLRGAARSEGGKAIVALPSTAKNGAISRIVPQLTGGSPIVVTRGDVHYVVSEFGVAYLHGKSIRERALALIEIAHPAFRQALLEEAKKLRYLFEDQELPSLTQHVYPHEWETTVKLDNDEEISIRPIKATDERPLQQLYYSLSDKDVFLRFMGNDPHFPHRRMQALTVVDYDRRMALVATIGPLGNEKILGIGRYDIINPDSCIAEVAFTVREDWRRMRVGAILLEHLTVIAKSKGVKGFRAEILAQNQAMMRLFHTSGAKMHSQIEDGLYSLWYMFDELENGKSQDKT